MQGAQPYDFDVNLQDSVTLELKYICIDEHIYVDEEILGWMSPPLAND